MVSMEISSFDAERYALSDGAMTRITSKAGEVIATIKITDMLPKGTLFMPAPLPNNPVNKLFDFTLDPEAKTPSLKTCNVKIERIGIDE